MIVYLIFLVVAILFVAPILLPGLDTFGMLGGLFNFLTVIIRFVINLIS